jgi:hypothetical protein
MAAAPAGATPAGRVALAGLVAATWLGCVAAVPVPQARGVTLEDLRQLENLINAAGTETVVAEVCPANHAGYYENDGRGRDRLVICQRSVNLGDVEAVWEVMAHEATHIMQACTGAGAIADAHLPATYRELKTLAPHYAKLIDTSYPSADRRLEAEAFWMELQPPTVVLELFRRNCAPFLPAEFRPSAGSSTRRPPG